VPHQPRGHHRGHGNPRPRDGGQDAQARDPARERPRRSRRPARRLPGVRWRFFIAEAFHSIRGNVATTIAASLTVLIVTFLLAVFASLGLFLYDKTVGVRNDVTVKAYMKMGTDHDPATLNKVRNELVAIPYVRTVTYVSPAAA